MKRFSLVLVLIFSFMFLSFGNNIVSAEAQPQIKSVKIENKKYSYKIGDSVKIIAEVTGDLSNVNYMNIAYYQEFADVGEESCRQEYGARLKYNSNTKKFEGYFKITNDFGNNLYCYFWGAYMYDKSDNNIGDGYHGDYRTNENIDIAIGNPLRVSVDNIYTNSKDITGKTSGGADVYVYIETATDYEQYYKRTKADKNGNYKIPMPSNKLVTYVRIAVEHNYKYADTVTKVKLSSPKVKLSSPKVNSLYNKGTSITGTAEKGSTVTAYVGSKSIGSAKVDKKGNYKINIKSQKLGTKVTIIAKNSSYQSDKVYTTVKLSTPKVNSIYSKSKSITGKGENGTTVTAYVGSNSIGSAKVDKKGNYKIGIKSQKLGTKITIVAKSGSYKSDKIYTTVKLSTPKVNSINYKSKSITGKGESGTTVTAYVGSKSIGSAKVDKKGNYKISIKSQKVGIKITIVAKSGSYKSDKIYTTVKK